MATLATLQMRDIGEGETTEVTSLHPLPVKVTLPAPVPQWESTHVAAGTATTTINGGAPVLLHAVQINTKGATANTLTIYNGPAATGDTKAVIDTTVQPGWWGPYDMPMRDGAVLVSASGTGADYTVLWAPLTVTQP